MADKPQDKGIFYVGVDLGSFKTSIAATNGARETFISAVGYPKDEVSKKLFGQSTLYGEDALKHRLGVDLVKPFEKGFLKYHEMSKDGQFTDEEIKKHQKAAREVLKHAIDLTRPPKGTLIYGVIGAPARASIKNKQALLDVAKNIFESVMIVSEPFAVAYGTGTLEDALIIDIGAGTIDLCRMRGAMPTEEDQITINTAGDYLDEVFLKLISQNHKEVQITINMAREIKEKFSFVHDLQEKVLVSLPVQGKPTQVDLTKELKLACQMIIPPIVDELRHLIATFDPEFQRRMLNNIILAGDGSQLRGLDRLIEEALKEYGGGSVRKVNEPVFAGANGALKLAAEMPENYWTELKK